MEYIIESLCSGLFLKGRKSDDELMGKDPNRPHIDGGSIDQLSQVLVFFRATFFRAGEDRTESMRSAGSFTRMAARFTWTGPT